MLSPNWKLECVEQAYIQNSEPLEEAYIVRYDDCIHYNYTHLLPPFLRDKAKFEKFFRVQKFLYDLCVKRSICGVSSVARNK